MKYSESQLEKSFIHISKEKVYEQVIVKKILWIIYKNVLEHTKNFKEN